MNCNNKMFFTVSVFLVTISLILPISTGNITENKTGEHTGLVEHHTVLAEYGTLSSCPYCPPVSDYLQSIYQSGSYDFYYVSLVADKNDKANERCLQLGITRVPDVHFDGGFTNVLGERESTEPYEDAIEICNYRAVHDLDMSINASMTDDGKIYIDVSMVNHECCGGAYYHGHLRVFVVEKESRWSDQSGAPYHYAMLDYAYNDEVTVVHYSDNYISAFWNGQEYNVDRDNIMVIAALYEQDTNYMTEVAGVEPTVAVDTNVTEGPSGTIDYREVTFSWIGTSPDSSSDLKYSYILEPYETEWSAWSDVTTTTYHDLLEGVYTFWVKAKNADGIEDSSPAKRHFTLSVNPPQVEITKPTKHLYIYNIRIPIRIPLVIGHLDVTVDADDECGIEKVMFYVDGEMKKTVEGSPFEYRLVSNRLSFKKVFIQAVAYDNVGNNATAEITVWKFL